jgi:hypothetical protein
MGQGAGPEGWRLGSDSGEPPRRRRARHHRRRGTSSRPGHSGSIFVEGADHTCRRTRPSHQPSYPWCAQPSTCMGCLRPEQTGQQRGRWGRVWRVDVSIAISEGPGALVIMAGFDRERTRWHRCLARLVSGWARALGDESRLGERGAWGPGDATATRVRRGRGPSGSIRVGMPRGLGPSWTIRGWESEGPGALGHFAGQDHEGPGPLGIEAGHDHGGLGPSEILT